MSGVRHSSASVPTESRAGSPTSSQAEMKDKTLQEFERATFVDDLTAQGAPLQANPNDVQRVLDHLRDNYELTHVSLFSDGNSTAEDPRLPSNGFTAVETRSYEPFTHLLNRITHSANLCLTGPRYLETLRFDPYGIEMLEKLDSRKPLKPDILGLLHSRTPQEPRVSWNDIAVFVEVKAHLLVDTIKQLATYARNYLAFNRRRSFSIAMSFHPEELSLRFLCFHRSGISTSPQLHLRTEDGFRSVVGHMVGLLSIKDEEAFGLDMTRAKDVYRLNNCNYEIVRIIYVRESICGHSTVVYSLKRQTASAQGIRASLRSRELARRVSDEVIDEAPQLPEKIIYKLSYQRQGRPPEGDLFSSFLRQFGVVDVVGYHICSSESFGSTAHLFSDPRFLKIGQSPIGSPEYRYLHCTAMGLEGLPLLYISDTKFGIPMPAELLETILHSMIGHFNLFCGGVLHRDISSGNILRLQRPIERSIGYSMNFLAGMLPVEEFEDVDLCLCRGFLIDGDHAIKWREDEIASSDPSGTLPFMSLRLLDALDGNQRVLHTPVDDLESFLWVLVWSLAHILASKEKKKDEDTRIHRILTTLSSRHIPDILDRERLVAKWPDRVFRNLILKWLKIARNSRHVLERLEDDSLSLSDDSDSDAQERNLDDIEDCGRKTYKAFFQAGYKHLQHIREFSDWEAVLNFTGKPL